MFKFKLISSIKVQLFKIPSSGFDSDGCCFDFSFFSSGALQDPEPVEANPPHEAP